jgi:hypothetical protein
MNDVQLWLLSMILCFFIATVTGIAAGQMMWTHNVNWLGKIVLLFYFGGIVSLVGLLFTVAAHL